MKILINQIGYELSGPKRFVCVAEDNLGPSVRFDVLDGAGRSLIEGTCRRFEGPTDGSRYYVGEFSALSQAGGDFRIRLEAGGDGTIGPRFSIGSSVLWRLTKPIVMEMLRSVRAERVRGTFRGDGRPYDMSGGWFDSPQHRAGTIRVGARVLLALSLALLKDPRDAQVRREFRWGADWLRRLAFQYPSSGRIISRAEPGGEFLTAGAGDPEPHMALLYGFLCARAAEAFGDIDLLRRGERAWEEYREDLAGAEGPEAIAAMLLTEVALHTATVEPRYLASAERRVSALMGAIRDPGACPPLVMAALAEFASSLIQHPVTPAIKSFLGRCLDARAEVASRNVWGFAMPADAEIFPARAAEEAWAVLAARKATARPGSTEMASSALDWLLGVNRWGVCLLRTADAARPDGVPVGGLAAPAPEGETARFDICGSAAYLAAISML